MRPQIHPAPLPPEYFADWKTNTSLVSSFAGVGTFGITNESSADEVQTMVSAMQASFRVCYCCLLWAKSNNKSITEAIDHCDSFCAACTEAGECCALHEERGESWHFTNVCCSACTSSGLRCETLWVPLNVMDACGPQCSWIIKSNDPTHAFYSRLYTSMADPPHTLKSCRSSMFWWNLVVNGRLIGIRVLVVIFAASSRR